MYICVYIYVCIYTYVYIHACTNKKNGPKKRRPLAGPNHRSVFFKKNGGRSGAAIINPTACSVFSKANPVFANSYFLI